MIGTMTNLPQEKTQQIIDGINDIAQPEIAVHVSKAKYTPNDEFVILFPEPVLKLIESGALTFRDIRILLAYSKRMTYGNQINISQQDIADAVGTDRANVSKSLTKMTQLGMFYREGRSLYMSWHYIAKGNLADFMKAEKEKQKLLKAAENNN